MPSKPFVLARFGRKSTMKIILNSLFSLAILIGSHATAFDDFEKSSGIEVANTSKPFNPYFKAPQFKLPQTNSAFHSIQNDPEIPEYGMGKGATVLSALFPGVGLWRANGSAIALAYLPICYGLVGGGSAWWVYHKSRGVSKYNQYQETKIQSEMDALLEESNMHIGKVPTGQVMVGLGAAIWLFQLYQTYKHGKYNDLYRKRNNTIWKESLMNASGYYHNGTQTLNFSTRITLNFNK